MQSKYHIFASETTYYAFIGKPSERAKQDRPHDWQGISHT